MSSCTEYRDTTGRIVSQNPDGSIPAGSHSVITRGYLLELVKTSNPASFLYVVAFIWPAIFLIHRRYRPTSRLAAMLWFTEPLLLGGSVFMIFMAALLSDFDIGSYVGWIGIGIYFYGWSTEAVSKFRIWMLTRRPA
jgi:hypothetical protein